MFVVQQKRGKTHAQFEGSNLGLIGFSLIYLNGLLAIFFVFVLPGAVFVRFFDIRSFPQRWFVVFLGSLTAASVTYLAFAGYVTVAGGLSVLGMLASAGLWVAEAAALVIAGSFAFESCDVICRTG